MQFVASVANVELQQEQHPVSVATAAIVALLLPLVSVAVAVVLHSHLGDFLAKTEKRRLYSKHFRQY